MTEQEIEEAFDKLVQEFLRKADAIPCTKEDYIIGLDHAMSEIHTAIEAEKKS